MFQEMLLTPPSERAYVKSGESRVYTDPAAYEFAVHSIPASLVTASDKTCSFGLVFEGLGLHCGPPVGGVPRAGCRVGDHEVVDEVVDGPAGVVEPTREG